MGWAKHVLGQPGASEDVAEARAGLVQLGSLSSDAPQELFAAQALMEAGDFAEAEACCDRAERLLLERGEVGLMATALLRRGQLRRRQCHAERALGLLRGPAQSGTPNPEASLELAELLFERGERDAARSTLAAAFTEASGGAELPFVRRARDLRAALGVTGA